MKLSTLTNKQIPVIGYGTYQLRGMECLDGTIHALKWYLWDIDYQVASIYRNGKDIGQALAQVKLDRGELFITSKISPAEQGFDSTLTTCQRLIDEMGCGYLDLLLIHWPGVAGLKPEDPANATGRLETYRALELLLEQKRIRGIGVSNFLKRHLEHLLANVKVKPLLNQIEVHPLGWDVPTVEFCQKHDIMVEAYSPLARQDPKFTTNLLLLKLAETHKRSLAQISLRWGLQKGFIVIPKSKNPKYIEENFNVLDFELSPQEIQQIDGLNVGLRTCWDPEKVTY